MTRLATLLAAVAIGVAASVAFSRLSGVSAVAAMAWTLAAVVCLALAMFLAFTGLTSHFD